MKSSGGTVDNPMKILLTGAAGFVAKHLIRELLSAGHSVATTDAVQATGLPEFHMANLCNAKELRDLVAETHPDACIHLGAISSVMEGESDPGKLFAVNIGGTMNLMRAIKEVVPSARLLFISTAQVYGVPADAANTFLTEDAPVLPLNAYSISKSAAERAVMAQVSTYNLDAVIARPSNHTGPGQSSRFVAASFVNQAKKILCGEADSYITGNLESVRDFSDVRDVVRAYRMLIERGLRGETYNITSGTLVTIGSLLDSIRRISGANAPAKIDPALMRPTDSSQKLDTSRLRTVTGWTPTLTLEDTLRDMLA